jgi:hypothetical protein
LVEEETSRVIVRESHGRWGTGAESAHGGSSYWEGEAGEREKPASRLQAAKKRFLEVSLGFGVSVNALERIFSEVQ